MPETFKGIDYDKVVELFFTPKKFEGLVVVKLGEAIEVTGTGMYSLKPGEMIQDDVSFFFLKSVLCKTVLSALY